jgi:hypothetical protein
MKKYLLNGNKTGYTKENQKTYNDRIVDYAKRGLQDLTLLAQKLPEGQQAEIFNEKDLGDLFRALFSLKEGHGVRVEAAGISYTPDAVKRRQRIINVLYAIFNEIGDPLNAETLAPDIYNILLQGGSSETLPQILGLKAVYLKGFRQAQNSPG